MKAIRLIGRGSRLSILQLEKVKTRINQAFPSLQVEIIIRNSRGDALQEIPLHTVEGTDFFTQDIFDALATGEADIAVHSLKDMSSEHFFGSNRFAVVDRDDVRDVAIFRKETEQKIKDGAVITIGTCSPRREEMAVGFLQRALPQWNKSFKIETKSIRGNVDTRLRKLDAGEYDAIILATAGLNRLLASGKDAEIVKPLLENKKLVFLPLVECVPAPCQGAIVAEANPSNCHAIAVLTAINNAELMNACVQEKQTAGKYGAGCLQRFGVTSFGNAVKRVIYAGGKDSDGNYFSNWTGLPELETANRRFFSSTDFMGSFFDYDYKTGVEQIKEPAVYIANYKAVQQEQLINQLHGKRIWASGSRTWFELADKGLWVEGCADAFGLESLEKLWSLPISGIAKAEIRIITNEEGAAGWKQKGWKTSATYSLRKIVKNELAGQLKEAEIIFWTSFQQYKLYKDFVGNNVQHVCPYGETAEQFKKEGLSPVVFPTIKAFQQWRKSHFPSHSEG